ncbi:MAG: class IV adenylate cyclase [Bryobacteraceae bacterium]|jgi:adenylate cyclase class 2
MQSAQFHAKADPTREIEVKLRVQDAERAAAVLLENGFLVVQPRAFEANEIFDTPERALRAERRLLRLREFAGAAIFTYKGTPEAGRHKSREELETVVSDPGALRQILERLGLRLFFRYEKYRTIYQRPDDTAGLAVLDETPIGVWLELEGEPEWIDRTAAQLGFTAQQYVTESYGGLWLKYCQEHAIDRPNMVFGDDPV